MSVAISITLGSPEMQASWVDAASSTRRLMMMLRNEMEIDII